MVKFKCSGNLCILIDFLVILRCIKVHGAVESIKSTFLGIFEESCHVWSVSFGVLEKGFDVKREIFFLRIVWALW